MAKEEENIDIFFKQGIDKVDVAYNSAHWDKLQKALLASAAAGTAAVIATSKWQVILKFLKLYKIYFITAATAGVVTTTTVVYFSKEDKPLNNVSPTFVKDTINHSKPEQIEETDTPAPIGKQYKFQPSIITLSDTPRYVSPYKLDTTFKANNFRKDSIITTKKDSVKKKNLNVFW